MNSTSIHPNDPSDSTRESESSHLTSEWSIGHDGRYYVYDGYRYERLVDAVAYAQLVRERRSPRTGSLGSAQFNAVKAPNAADRQLMLELSISFENHTFLFEGYRYERLIDAVNYALHRQRLSEKTL